MPGTGRKCTVFVLGMTAFGERSSVMEIRDIINRLSIREKAALVGGADAWNTVAVKRLGIPDIRVSDGPHGLRKSLDDESLGIDGTVQAVCFPTGAGLGATFDRDLIRHMGTVLGRECRAEHVDVLLGPAVNIKRSPLCGRNFEYLSEDPYLAGQLASEYVKGVQSEGVGVSLKHFAANNQEKRRMTVSAVIDERTLREIYLSAFEEVVKKACPDTVMCSYNKINGVYSSENPRLLNEILRKEWGFEGLVMSDWGAVCDRPKGVEAGLDLEMPSSNGINAKKVEDAVINGILDEKYLDLAVEHVIKLADKYTHFAEKVTTELWEEDEQEKIYGVSDRNISGNIGDDKAKAASFDRIADHKEARKIARESMVLLKNNGALPLKKDSRILFVGEFARKPRIQGGGSSHINCTRIISALQASARHTKVSYAKGFSSTEDKIDPKLAADAVEKAGEADVVVVFAGLPDSFESEGYDRKHMRLPQCQNRLIRAICEVQPNTVVVLHNGSPVSMPWIDSVNAVLEAYLGGEASGEAVVDILFGVFNPCGKLAETFPLGIKDTPCYRYFPGNRLTVEYREGLFTGYRYYDKVGAEVLFPFGHGLSYTSFTYSEIKVNTENNKVKVKFKINNSGDIAGSEVAQIYVSKMNSRILRAPRELKGFEKVRLAPGQTKEIEIELDERAFSFYSTAKSKWIIEPGKYEIIVGSSSRDIRLRDSVDFDVPDETGEEFTPDQLPSYFSGSPACVTDEEFALLIGHDIPVSSYEEGDRFNIDKTLEDIRCTSWGRQLYVPLMSLFCQRKMTRREAYEEECISEMPLHSLICMSGGRLPVKTGEEIVELINRENIRENLKSLGRFGLKTAKEMISPKVTAIGNSLNINDCGKKQERNGEKEMADKNLGGIDPEKIGEKLGEAGAKLGKIGKDLFDKLEEKGVKEKLESAGLKIGDKIDELELDKKIGNAVDKLSGKAGEFGESIRKGFKDGKDS